MKNQENRQAQKSTGEAPDVIDGKLRTDSGEEGANGQAGWRNLFRQAFEKARRAQQPVTSRRELGKDKSKALLVLAGTAVVVGLLFLGIFSSPNKPKRRVSSRPGTPDLGRRATPGQEKAAQGKSVTPLLEADVRGNQNANNGAVTPDEVGRTAKPRGSMPQSSPVSVPPAPATQNKNQYALSQIDFSDPALKQQPGYGAGPTYQQTPPATSIPGKPEEEQLRKPSLVFVRSTSETVNGPAASGQSPILQLSEGVHLPPGTRLVARLESPASTAVKQPVIAVVEYSYERDGEIVVPAGAKAVGQLRQADRNGFVDIKFDSLEMPDGSSGKLDGVAMGLDFKPLKGSVAGKQTGTKFLVRAFTGLGTVASYLVGNGGSTGFYGPLSESALLRERIANNLGAASDQELNQLAVTQSIVVTIPANTRLYIVLETTQSPKNASAAPASPAASASPKGLPTLDELRQLMQLKQELSVMYQQASAQPASAAAQQ